MGLIQICNTRFEDYANLYNNSSYLDLDLNPEKKSGPDQAVKKNLIRIRN